MFHTPRAPYTTCTYFTNFTYNQYIRPCILLHAVPTFLPILPPPSITRYYNFLLLFSFYPTKVEYDTI